MNDPTIVAIDPGLTGAVAFMRPARMDDLDVHDMPVLGSEVNAHALRDMLAMYKPSAAIIEKVGPMPRDGVMAAWRFSASYSVAKTVCMLFDIPVGLISSSQWKKEMQLPGGPAGKEASRLRAVQLFPAQAAMFARKKDHNRAEAALLCWQAARKFNSEKAWNSAA